jgi:hypothetical protein
MKSKPTPQVEACRLRSGPMASDERYGNNGQFIVYVPKSYGIRLFIQISDECGWEHASVSLVDWQKAQRCPTWGEMCYVKDLFWEDEECVIQYHPPKSQYKNVHPFVLHLWKPVFEGVIPMPPISMV